MSFDSSAVNFSKGDGLVPAIVQDADTGAVLMLAYMNREALEQTLGLGAISGGEGPKVSLAGVLGDEQRIEGTAEEAGEEAGEDVVGSRHLIGRRVQAHGRGQGSAGRTKVLHDGPEGGEVGRLILRVGVGPKVAVPGQHVVHRHGVRVVGMADGADDGVAVCQPGQSRDVLAQARARHARGDRVELAAILAGGVRLEVPGILVRGRAKQEDHNARPGPSAGPRHRLPGERSTLQHRRQRQPGRADAQPAAARDRTAGGLTAVGACSGHGVIVRQGTVGLEETRQSSSFRECLARSPLPSLSPASGRGSIEVRESNSFRCRVGVPLCNEFLRTQHNPLRTCDLPRHR